MTKMINDTNPTKQLKMKPGAVEKKAVPVSYKTITHNNSHNSIVHGRGNSTNFNL